MDVERSIDIAAPPEKVWAFVSEPELVLQWYLPLKKFEYTGERCHEAGAPLRFEEKVAGRTMKLDCVVTEWEANRSFGFKMLRGDMMKNYQEKWTIHATPSGSRFTFHERRVPVRHSRQDYRPAVGAHVSADRGKNVEQAEASGRIGGISGSGIFTICRCPYHACSPRA